MTVRLILLHHPQTKEEQSQLWLCFACFNFEHMLRRRPEEVLSRKKLPQERETACETCGRADLPWRLRQEEDYAREQAALRGEEYRAGELTVDPFHHEREPNEREEIEPETIYEERPQGTLF